MSSDSFQILNQNIERGEQVTLELELAKLHTRTSIKVPILVNRSMVDGPVLLIMAGVHGDETNGVAIVRELIKQTAHIPDAGTIICIPVLNIFGFLNHSRYFPDGKDLNRVFPGKSGGSLASQFAYSFSNDIAPVIDFAIDFHTGAAGRDNAAQIRCDFNDKKAKALAKVFNPPFIIHSKTIKNSIRETMRKMGKTVLLFEGGKSNYIDTNIVAHGVRGTLKVMRNLGVLHSGEKDRSKRTVILDKTKWLRSPYSGMLMPRIINGCKIKKGSIMATISDPFGEFEKQIKAPHDCYVFCVNQSPIVYKGNALFHISAKKD